MAKAREEVTVERNVEDPQSLFFLKSTIPHSQAEGSHHEKKVMFLWTLSVPPLAPPPRFYGRLRGSFF